MQASKLQHSFENVVSFDDGETIEIVTVGYDYYPEEFNLPYDHNTAEIFDVFVFDAQGKHITYDIPNDEYKRLMDEAKSHFHTLEAV
jgi:hypothetical protein